MTVRVEGKSSSASWVVDMEKMVEQANPSMEMVLWKQRSIRRVPEFIKELTNSKSYKPHFVSLGPLHHGERHLLPMEQHKRRAMLHIVNRSGKHLQEFVAVIEEVVEELQGAYNDLDDKWRGANKGRFVEMMVTDGCFLLELMFGVPARGNYAANDPIFSKNSFCRLWPIMRNDMVAMENQLPLVVLQRLLSVIVGTSPEAKHINSCVLFLLDRNPLDEEDMENLGLHFLDLFHKSYCSSRPNWEGCVEYEACTPCASELMEAGIQFKRSDTDSIHNVNMENSTLSMPKFTFDEGTEIPLLNLMAFEWLHPEVNLDVCCHMFFMEKIIRSEKDVELLRSKGLFQGIVGSEKRAVEMFNTLVKLSWTASRGSRLGHVQWKLNEHCRKRRNKWRASFVNTYLSNPWVFISLTAAIILLIATLLQTIYTIVPFYTKN